MSSFLKISFDARLGVYGVGLPTRFKKPRLDELDTNDTIPSNIDPQ